MYRHRDVSYTLLSGSVYSPEEFQSVQQR